LNVLIIAGHPRRDSFSHALADAFEAGAREAGVAVERIDLTDGRFDPNVTMPSPARQHFEDDIVRGQALIRWADHIVFVYPTWWGTMPALLKGFLDRTLTPGFAFADREEGGWDKLLEGRTAQIVTTMDTPRWVYRWIYGAPGHRAMARATLGFCGIGPVRVASYGPIKDSTATERSAWLADARALGRALERGVLTRAERLGRQVSPWLKAIRFQFYPMTLIAYTIGAFAATEGGRPFDTAAYWLGFLCLFLIEAATVFTNDRYDFDSDRNNRNYGPFNGGSRVIVDGLLSFGQLRAGAGLALIVAAVAGVLALAASPGSGIVIVALLLATTVIGIGYTAPPLKLSHRALGEIDVGVTHSFAVILLGFVLQGGHWSEGAPWGLALPLFLSVLPAITLSGLPDYEADAAAGKTTLAVALGREGALRLSMALVLAAALAGLIFNLTWPAAFAGIAWIVLPHAALLTWRLGQYYRRGAPGGRIDGLMVNGLTYILWFGLVPLINLW